MKSYIKVEKNNLTGSEVVAAVILALLALVGGGAVGFALMFWRAYVASVLWGWFAVPLFGVPPLTFIHAVGLSLTVAVLLRSSLALKKEEEADLGKTFINLLLTPLIYLAVGWFIKCWL